MTVKKFAIIWIDKETKERLASLGRFGDTFNTVIKRLLDKCSQGCSIND